MTEINRVEELANDYYWDKENVDTHSDVHHTTIEKAFITGFKAGYSTSQAKWQLCPKCGGTGMAMNFKNYIPTTMDTCDVCNGAKIIAPPGYSTSQSGVISWDEFDKINKAFQELSVKYDNLLMATPSSPSTREWAKNSFGKAIDEIPKELREAISDYKEDECILDGTETPEQLVEENITKGLREFIKDEDILSFYVTIIVDIIKQYHLAQSQPHSQGESGTTPTGANSVVSSGI